MGEGELGIVTHSGAGGLWRETVRYITCSLAIDSLVKQGLAWDKAPLLERSPLEILQELCYACLPFVLPCHKPCSFTLHCLQLFDVVNLVWVPCATSVF